MSLRPNCRADARKKSYKVAMDVVEARHKREDTLIDIRKTKREDNLLKKRRGALEPLHFPSQPQSFLQRMLEKIPAMVSGVYSDDLSSQMVATTEFRKLLANEQYPTIDEVVHAGVVPQFVKFLTWHHVPQLQFEAAWSLTNIASGTSEHTKIIIDHGAVPHFVQLLSSSSYDVREQAIWALANIAADGPKFRDIVLNHGALMPLIALLNENDNLSTLKHASWALSNLCRGTPQAPFEQIKPALPALEYLIRINDEEILTNACWALVELSYGEHEKIQAVIDAGVCQRLVELLLHPSPSVYIPVLRTVGNIVTGEDVQTQVIIDNKVLPCLLTLLTKNDKKITKETCWTISNITAGTKDQIQAIIDAKIVPSLVHLVKTAELNIKKEVAWAISNATTGASLEQIKYLVSQGCIEPLCNLLTCPDSRVVMVCLEGLENILRSGAEETEDWNSYTQSIEVCEGLDKIENLQNHGNSEIYEKAVKIIETYWTADSEDENIDPTATNSQQTFNFGANQAQNPPCGFTFS